MPNTRSRPIPTQTPSPTPFAPTHQGSSAARLLTQPVPTAKGKFSPFRQISLCSADCLPPIRSGRRASLLTRCRRTLAVGRFIAMIPLALMLAATPGSWSVGIVRSLLLRCFADVGLRIVVQDERGEHTELTELAGQLGHTRSGRGTLVVSNHISWIDIPTLALLGNVRFVSRHDVADWPIIGKAARRSGTLFINRDSLLDLPQVIEQTAADIRSGFSVLAFPESTTWCGHSHGRFYPAMFDVAARTGCTIQPVEVSYRDADGHPTSACAFVGAAHPGHTFARLINHEQTTLVIRLATPIQAQVNDDRRRLAEAAQQAVFGPGVAPHVASHCASVNAQTA